jgi:tetratricopeptide (TPR) repeat protein
MKVVHTIIISCTLFANLTFADNQTFIDSLQNEIKIYRKKKEELRVSNSNLNDTLIVNNLYKISQLYWNTDRKLAYTYAKECLDLSRKIGYKLGEAKAYTSMGVINYNKGEYSLAIDYHNKSLQIRKKYNDNKGVLKCYNNLGNVYALMSNYPLAIENYYKSLKIAEDLKSKADIGTAYENLANIYFFIDRNKEAKEYYIKALKINKEINDSEGIAHLNLNLGKVYLREGNIKIAIEKYEQSLNYYLKTGDQFRTIDSYISLGRAYIRLEDYKKAYENFDKAKDLCIEADYNDGLISVYGNMAKTLIIQKNFTEAKILLNKTLALSKKLKTMEYTASSYKLLTQIDSLTGNFKSAYFNYFQYVSYNDSIKNSEKLNQIAQSKMQYNFDKKEAAIKAKQAIKDAIAKEKIQQQRIIILSVVLGSALLLLSLLFFINRRKTKHALEVNKLENKTLRSQLNPHFIFNALASIQKYMNEYPDKAENYLAKFAKLMREVLENSEKEYISLVDEFEMLKNYMDLEKLRVKNGFTYQFNIHENIDLEEFQTPPLLLQPIIENAIWHGVAKDEGHGEIIINVDKSDEFLKFEIENKSDSKVDKQIANNTAQEGKRKSFGQQIVRERLNLLSKEKGKKCQMEMASTAHGMKVTVLIPNLN